MTDRDRATYALRDAVEQAIRNSNMGQIEYYRINRVVYLMEQVRSEERRRCARIADEIRRDPGQDSSPAAGIWRLACSEISQRISSDIAVR